MALVVNIFFKIFKLVETFEVTVLVFCTALMASLSMLNVVSRTFFMHTFAFVEELNQFFIIAITFVGAGYATAQARHIRMSAIYDALPKVWRKRLMLLTVFGTAGICFSLTWFGIEYVGTVRELGTRSPVLHWPYWCVYALAPIGMFTTGIQYLLTAIRNLTSEDVYMSFEHQDHQSDLSEIAVGAE